MLRKRHLQEKVRSLEIAAGKTPSVPAPRGFRLRDRGRRLEGSELLDKAISVAMRPEIAGELPRTERQQVDEVVKAISVASGYVKKQGFRPNQKEPKAQGAAVVAARAHQLLGPSSGVTPTDIAVALVQQGMDFVEPFAPGTPLQPFYGYGRPPRTYDYRIGRNITTETREGRIPFETLDRLYRGYDVAQICTRHAINSLRAMVRSMHFGPAPGCDRYPAAEIAEVQKRLRRPDGKTFFANWLATNMLDLWKYDSAPIYRSRDKAGNVTKLTNISAKVIAPMLDYFGNLPDAPAPAFQQFIQGVPWDWLTLDDILYAPFWPETDSIYGTPPLETVLINSNSDVRLQLFFLQFFTSGVVPEAFAMAPEDMTSSDDIADFQEEYDSETTGDQAKRYGLRWLPHGTEIVFYKPQSFDPDLAEYVMRRTVSAYLEVPHNLGFTDDVNRAAGDTQMDVEERINDVPLAGYYEAVIDSVIQEDWSLPVSIHLDVRVDRKDELQEAQARQIYWRMGALRATDVRNKLGYPVDPREQSPLGVMDERLGWMPMAHAIAVAGDVDQITGMPMPDSVTPVPYALPGGGNPVPAAGPQGQGGQLQGGGASPKGDPTKAYPRPLLSPQNAAAKEQTRDDDRGEPGWGAGAPSGSPDDEVGYGSLAQGTGVRVVPGPGPQEDLAAERTDLAKWRRQALKAVSQGKRPRLFEDSAIRPEVSRRVFRALSDAVTREQVSQAFKSASPKAAGIVVQADDTKRVLMVQRTPDKHDDGEAYARFEFPGGRLDGGDGEPDASPWEGALREWEEETGAELPQGFEHRGTWISPDGVYQGFVVSVPRESDIVLDPDEDEVSQASWWSKDDLDDPKVRDKVTDTLHLVEPLLKAWQDQQRRASGKWRKPATYSDFHRRTDLIVDRFTPLVADAMSAILDKDDIARALVIAFGSSPERLAKAQKPKRQMAQPQPAQPTPTTALAPNVATAVSTGMAGLGAAGAGATGAVGAGAAGAIATVSAAHAAAAGAVVVALLLAARKLKKLRQVITDLYVQGTIEGTAEASDAANVAVPEDVAPYVAEEPEPGRGAGLVDDPSEALATLLGEVERWSDEISQTQVSRIGDAVREVIEQGGSTRDAAEKIDQITDDLAKARQISDTEYVRAQIEALMASYRRNNVPLIAWLAVPTACALCKENEAVSPQPVSDPQWPNGMPPVHPGERCSLAPDFGG